MDRAHTGGGVCGPLVPGEAGWQEMEQNALIIQLQERPVGGMDIDLADMLTQ